VLVGFAIIAGGMMELTAKNKLRRELTSKTDGVIISYIEDYSYDSEGDRQIDFYPIFTYTVDGQKYECTSSTRYGSVEVGKSVVVFYDPDNPDRCYLKGENKTFLQFFTIGAGVVVAIIGVRSFFISAKAKKPEKETAV